jgi:hypothetical protein
MPDKKVIVDTNVLIAANGKAPQVKQTGVEKCQIFVGSLFDDTIISIDSLNEIFGEYFSHLNRSGQPGIGDVFVKYLWDHQYDTGVCEIVELEHDNKYIFTVFSDKEDLLHFDHGDLKFIAVFFGSEQSPSIYNACDSDWEQNKQLLDKYKVSVIELLTKEKPNSIWG